LDVAFPVKYPKARCPMANVESPQSIIKNRGYTTKLKLLSLSLVNLENSSEKFGENSTKYHWPR